MQTMMSKIEATIYPDSVLRDLDIGLRVYRPLAGLRYSCGFHSPGQQEQALGSRDIGSDELQRESAETRKNRSTESL